MTGKVARRNSGPPPEVREAHGFGGGRRHASGEASEYLRVGAPMRAFVAGMQSTAGSQAEVGNEPERITTTF